MEQVLEYIKRAHQGDKAARDLLVQNNLGLVWALSGDFPTADTIRRICFRWGASVC